MIVAPQAFVLDAEALSAFAADKASIQPWITVARRTDSRLHVSAVSIVEVTDGSNRDAHVHRAIKAMRVESVTPETGFLAGQLRARAAKGRRKARDLTADAIVAATAVLLHGPVVVLTADPSDLALLLDRTEVKVERIG